VLIAIASKYEDWSGAITRPTASTSGVSTELQREQDNAKVKQI